MLSISKIIYEKLDPLTQKRVRSFKRMRRAYLSLWILSIAFVVSGFAEMIANNNPLFVYYKGDFYFPFAVTYDATEFGGSSAVEPNYKKIKETIEKDGFMIPPPIWWGYNESNGFLDSYPAGPNSYNLMGTDDRGRDVFVRVLYGFRLSMIFAIVTLFFALILGTCIGGLQGFFGGKFDLLGQRFVEMWVSLPPIFVVILVVNIFEPNVFWLMLIIVAFLWVSAQYYIRGESLRLKNKDFAKAASSFGASKLNVFFKHIVPNAITPMVTLAPFIMNQSILFLSFLDYLGLGVQPPTASIGELLRQGRDNFLTAWWLGFFPFLALVITLILLNFIGEGVRKAFDPRAT